MTTQTKKNLLGILSAVLTALLIALIHGGWRSKVDRSDFDLHVQDVRNWRVNHVQADSAWRREVLNTQRQQLDLLLEVLCEQQPASRRCR